MNTKKLKAITVSLALFAGIGLTTSAMAVGTGAQLLGSASSSVDVFTFSCPAGTGARARVNDTANPNPAGVDMQVVLGHDSFPIRQVTDVTDNNVASAYTPTIHESGLYVATFKKTGTGVEIYDGNIQCCTPAGNCAINPIGLTLRVSQ